MARHVWEKMESERVEDRQADRTEIHQSTAADMPRARTLAAAAKAFFLPYALPERREPLTGYEWLHVLGTSSREVRADARLAQQRLAQQKSPPPPSSSQQHQH